MSAVTKVSSPVIPFDGKNWNVWKAKVTAYTMSMGWYDSLHLESKVSEDRDRYQSNETAGADTAASNAYRTKWAPTIHIYSGKGYYV